MLTAAVALLCPLAVQAQTAESDSMRAERLQEVVVRGVRAQKNAPYAIENIKKRDLATHAKTGRELPFLFAQTPGVLAWSENGMGTGTTYMRIRGAGDSRINVTLDGMPLNSPEDQCVFWANMNSYGSLLGSVQIQRGVGTSTNGDGAFGGTVALTTATPLSTPSLEVSASYGSYNTLNAGVNFSTGLLFQHLVFDGAYHETQTDGFIHGTSGRSGSYYGGLTWLGDNYKLSYKHIGNFEKTGQAWNGVTAGDNDLSLMDGTYGAKTGIREYKDLNDRGLGRYNSLYEQLVYDANGDFARDANGDYLTGRYTMSDGSLWEKATDNFRQNHHLLSAAWTIDDHWSTTASLRYTRGYGYYREFRPQNKLSKFGLAATEADGTKIKRTDFIRKKGLSQDTYGAVWSANYKDEQWDVIGGLAVQYFSGNHFGYVTYAAHPVVAAKYLAQGDHKYYDSDAYKTDYSYYVKAAYHLNEQWDVFGDVQFRSVVYRTNGINDKFYDDASGLHNQQLDIRQHYDFMNPKAGITWHSGAHTAYASVAQSHREPERNNFTDNGSYPAPRAESLTDFELGYTYTADGVRLGVNLYYMDYTDQFVQTGLVSDIGENLTTNIDNSYRMGLEMKAGLDVTPWLSIDYNMALSRNRIRDFDEVVEDWDNGSQTIHYSSSTLAFSPSMISNAFVNLHHKGWQATWHTGYVSRQYLDNTESMERSLPEYQVSNLSLSYSTPLTALKVKEAVFGLNLNNIFNRHYAASGWVYSAICESAGHANDNRYYQIGYIPMAGFTMMGNVTLKF